MSYAGLSEWLKGREAQLLTVNVFDFGRLAGPMVCYAEDLWRDSWVLVLKQAGDWNRSIPFECIDSVSHLDDRWSSG